MDTLRELWWVFASVAGAVFCFLPNLPSRTPRLVLGIAIALGLALTLFDYWLKAETDEGLQDRAVCAIFPNGRACREIENPGEAAREVEADAEASARREAARIQEQATARRRQEEEAYWENCCNNENVTITAIDEYLARVQGGDFPGHYTMQAGQVRERLEANRRPITDLDPSVAGMSDSERFRAIEAQSRLETLRVAVGPACQLFGGTEQTYYGTTFYVSGNCRNQDMRSPDDTVPGCRVTSGHFHYLPRSLVVQDCVINGRFMRSCGIDWNGECGRG